MSDYVILDEPKPASYSHLAVNPFWIFLATMLGGVWLGWAWSAFNSFAIGSATKAKEIIWLVVGLAGSVALTLLGDWFLTEGRLASENLKYAYTVLVVWKLVVSYRLHLLQGPSFQLHEYFGGTTRNGILILLGGMFARQSVLNVFDGTILYFVLA